MDTTAGATAANLPRLNTTLSGVDWDPDYQSTSLHAMAYLDESFFTIFVALLLLLGC